MITFDGVVFSLKNRFGGVAVYFRELIRHAAGDGQPLRVLVHDAQLTAEGFGCSPAQLEMRQPRLLERYRSVGGVAPGIFHSSYYRTTAQRGVRNVITVYDFTYEKFARGLPALVHTRQKMAAILRADAVTCISENTRRDLFELLPQCPRDKVFVTHLAAGDSFHPLDSPKVAVTERPFVLFVSGRTTYKNFAAAVGAVALRPELALVCVGGGPFSAEERVLLEKTLPGRHFHSGSIDAAGLNALYNAAICLVYPSRYEGFGIPPLEAMKAGCPFVALRTSSLPEVAGPAGILLEASDARAIALAIDECNNPGRRSELRQAGFEQAGKFSWRKTYDETVAIYDRLKP